MIIARDNSPKPMKTVPVIQHIDLLPLASDGCYHLDTPEGRHTLVKTSGYLHDHFKGTKTTTIINGQEAKAAGSPPWAIEKRPNTNQQGEASPENHVMPLVAKDTGSKSIPAPTGNHNAVCVDVVDKGVLETFYNNQSTGFKHKIVVIWEIDEPHPEFKDALGKPSRFQVSKQYTLSLNPKATLYKDLVSWRGKPFTDEEREGFDVERLLGAPCMLNVVHNESGGTTYANVSSVTPLPKGMQKLEPSPDYVRVMHREEGWDVRSPGSTAKQAGDDAGSNGYDDSYSLDDHRPPAEDNFAANADEDDLPF